MAKRTRTARRPTKGAGKRPGRAAAKKTDRLKWWREARFGMFIHWGVYAVPAGIWKGKDVPGIGEWIMNRARIPVEEYEKLAKKLNPVKFNATEWVRIAKRAGMKYIVITSKHHDGFAMYDSKVSDWDIVDATPWGKDPIAALAKACRKAGIRLCFYYSQSQDWHDPDAMGNRWDFPDEEKKDFTKYLEEKVKPQLRELLTQYGPIGLIWFDTPQRITRAQSLTLKRYVHKLQPKCIVSGRVGHGVGDYDSMGDNMIPAGRVKGEWETPATINRTWGFKTRDKDWKSVETLLHLLVDLASKGVNYLLNVGPTRLGVIPPASVKRLDEIGKWLKVNGEAIRGTGPSPFPYELDWGRITQKRGKLYLHFMKWPGGKFTLYGLKSKVKKAYLLAKKSAGIEFAQSHDRKLGHHVLTLKLPAKRPDRYVSVVVLEIGGETKVDESPIQQPDGTVTLPAHMSELHGRKMRIARHGAIENWLSEKEWLGWDFKVSAPGEFEVKLLTWHRRSWQLGHKVKVSVAGKDLKGTVRPDEKIDSPRTKHFPEVATRLGKVRIAKAGKYTLALRAEKIKKDAPIGLTASAVRLVPVR